MDHEEFGYVCGVLCGRGFIKRGRNNCIGLQTSKFGLAEEFVSALRSLTGYETPVSEKIVRGKRYFTVNAYGKSLVATFDNLNFRPKRKTWRPPSLAMENQKFRLGFLAGFFDSTSFVYFNREKFSALGSGYRYIRVTSVNPVGLKDVKDLLSTEGVESSLHAGKGLAYLVLRGDWRLKGFFEKIGLRTNKRELLARMFVLV